MLTYLNGHCVGEALLCGGASTGRPVLLHERLRVGQLPACRSFPHSMRGQRCELATEEVHHGRYQHGGLVGGANRSHKAHALLGGYINEQVRERRQNILAVGLTVSLRVANEQALEAVQGTALTAFLLMPRQ
jgi:hypothetical protein